MIILLIRAPETKDLHSSSEFPPMHGRKCSRCGGALLRIGTGIRFKILPKEGVEIVSGRVHSYPRDSTEDLLL